MGDPSKDARGSGGRLTNLWTRGGVGEKESKASSSESRISSISMKRDDAVGGVDGGCEIFVVGWYFEAGGCRVGVNVVVAGVISDLDFGGRPRRFFGDGSMGVAVGGSSLRGAGAGF